MQPPTQNSDGQTYLDVSRFGVLFSGVVFGNFHGHVQVGSQQTLRRGANIDAVATNSRMAFEGKALAVNNVQTNLLPASGELGLSKGCVLNWIDRANVAKEQR